MVTSSKPPAHPADSTMEVGPASGSLQNIVPACPQGLTITKGDFLKPDFTVDNFFIEVSVREGGTSLDVLRDDLGIYLKVLRSSMIELINQDYADFVNLSTNLVGLDQGILRIREPLERLDTEITGAREELGSCLEKVRVKLARQERIRQEKEMLANLQQVMLKQRLKPLLRRVLGCRHHGQGGEDAGDRSQGRSQHRHCREDRHGHQPAQLCAVEDEGRISLHTYNNKKNSGLVWPTLNIAPLYFLNVY